MIAFAFLYDLTKSLCVTKEVTQKKAEGLIPLLIGFRFTFSSLSYATVL